MIEVAVIAFKESSESRFGLFDANITRLSWLVPDETSLV